ncbi:MAG TPA: hypothetical protein VHK69_09205 [Chitinophagaceae bacterium]|jgi:hypothetical protein|nr:hypothetical protein [Chitinophagaceae bacterium]
MLLRNRSSRLLWLFRADCFAAGLLLCTCAAGVVFLSAAAVAEGGPNDSSLVTLLAKGYPALFPLLESAGVAERSFESTMAWLLAHVAVYAVLCSALLSFALSRYARRGKLFVTHVALCAVMALVAVWLVYCYVQEV